MAFWSAHALVQLIRWVMFALLTLTALAFFYTAVRRRVDYMRLGKSVQPKPPASHDPSDPENDDRDEMLQITSFTAAAAAASAAVPRSDRSLNWMIQVFGHRKLLKDIRSGIMHVVLFYGFIVLQFGAADMIWKGLTGAALPYPAYHAFVLTQEVTVTLVLLAIVYGAFRRYVERLRRLKRGWKPSVVLWLIGGLMLTVICTQAFDRLREAAPQAGQGQTAAVYHADRSSSMDMLTAQPVFVLRAADLLLQYMAAEKLSAAQTSGSVSASVSLYVGYAPVSSSLAEGFRELGLSASAGTVLHELFWWLHLALLLGFLVYVPQSKHFHIFTAPVNLWLRRRTPTGRLAPLDLEDEEAESFGVGAVEQFNRKQLLDLYACVECGRCTNVCPASSTGKMLSPMHLIVKLRDHLTEKGAAITSKSPWVPDFRRVSAGVPSAHVMAGAMPVWVHGERGAQTTIEPTMSAQRQAWNVREAAPVSDVALIGDVMTESELWACTSCRSCEEQCPVGNEHVDKIIDMRRYLVLTEGRVPAEAQRAMQNIERQGNPWGLPRGERAAWLSAYAAAVPEAAPVQTMRDAVRSGEQPELLLWAGTMGAYDQRSRKVLFAVVRLLQAAGVPFAVLGGEEKNSGDTARRLGNELLFQTLCGENVATLERYGIRRIVTICPHTFHALKNEYIDFGLRSSVVVEHHTTLLARLVAERRLMPAHTVKERVVYHDSCYLGRYNGNYDAPRELLRAIPGVWLLEMERSRANAMCCGAGGGLMWMEERSGIRVNEARTAQALETAPTVIGSACPYCLTMMEDGIKVHEAEDTVRARDVAELLAESVFGGS
ncbi:(Fe-S)-binding protein [Paenibacillus sp. R14(2021)]|uniref:(Fe-S)-binding protein n=1 Tax=Paenibacillus sp. R14(2021) TaxID=2859228 RepID=UPI0021578683|nr:(Fe-S)-binding protein [Paenibacillus sp. R14(2021)]